MKYHLLPGAGWSLLLLLLITPVHLAYQALGMGQTLAWVLLGSLGWALVSYALWAVLGRRWLALALVLLWIVLVGVRVMYLGLIQFSGFGFTPEFFLHLEPESVRIAWADYRMQLVAMLFLMSAVAALLAALLRQRPRGMGRLPAAGLLVLGTAGLYSARAALPEWQLLRAWQDWRQPASSTVDQKTLESWRQAGILELDLVDKTELRAEAAPKPKNLVLIYLESVGQVLIENPRWPGLMPHLRERLQSQRWVDHLETSAYITIEGIANSQCGTLLPFDRNSDSLAGGGRLFRNLPCLGDVLAAAGYHQVYLGGAQSEFAGKGEFLGAHGFDEVRGFEYWQAQGFTQRENSWGLSDVELLAEARRELRQLHAEARPFNLTLLTIGTHLPGFSYAECTPYRDGSRAFLNAVHCTDQLLAAFLEQAASEGLFENTVVVITADHHIFPSPVMRELFGDQVDDRRLPLLILGEGLPRPKRNRGASYDLAPSVLDLLGVRSNARFILGRSLLADTSRPEWLFSRYFDVAPGRRVENNPARCDLPPGKTLPPFDACGKKALVGELAAIAGRYVLASARLGCTTAQPTRFAFTSTAGTGLQALVGGTDLSKRFSVDGYEVANDRPGIYSLVFGPHGRLKDTRFVAEPELGQFVPEPPPSVSLLLRRPPDPAASTSPQPLASAGIYPALEGIPMERAGAWLLASNRPPQALAEQDGVWSLDEALCRAVFWDPGTFSAR